MSLYLVKETSDTNYPYRNSIIFGHPGVWHNRLNTRLTFNRMLHTIDARDYKFIEHNYGFNLLFKYKIDDVHHDKYFMEKLTDPNSLVYGIPSQKTTILGAYFNELARAQGLSDKVNICVRAEAETITFQSSTLADYFTFWRHVPRSNRLEFKVL